MDICWFLIKGSYECPDVVSEYAVLQMVKFGCNTTLFLN